MLSRYIPLGGQRTQLWSMWIIFTFVGLWHDLWCIIPTAALRCAAAHTCNACESKAIVQVALACLGVD